MSCSYTVLLGDHDPEESNRALFYEHPIYGQRICCRCQEFEMDLTCSHGHRLCEMCTIPKFRCDLSCPFMDCPGRVPAEALYRRKTKGEATPRREGAAAPTVDMSHNLISSCSSPSTMSNLSDLLLEKLDPIGSKRAKLDERPPQVPGQKMCCCCEVMEARFGCRGGHNLCINCIFPTWVCSYSDCPGREQTEATRRQSKREAPASTEEASTQTGVDLSHALSSSENTEASQPLKTAQKEESDSRSDLSEASVDLDFIGCPRPPNWTAPADVHRKQGYALVKVSPHSLEVRKVLDLIPDLPPSSIKAIERVENRDLWERFTLKKRQMARTMSPLEINERDLFTVVTKKRVDIVAKQGYDSRQMLRGPRRFGQGVEFAVKLQERPAHDSIISVSKVLCGSWTEATPNMLCPPERMDGQPYDSCVDSLVNPKVVILYENSQNYPCYFIYLQ